MSSVRGAASVPPCSSQLSLARPQLRLVGSARSVSAQGRAGGGRAGGGAEGGGEAAT